MTTDRELLEGAAKAAGCVYLMNGQLYVEGKGNIDWNPLTDDGDALRLAVKLKIHINFPLHCSGCLAISPIPNGIIRDCIETDADADSATRRAIVRAAAEIGKVSRKDKP